MVSWSVPSWNSDTDDFRQLTSSSLDKWLSKSGSRITNVELNAGARDASFTYAITVMLTSSSKAVCQHTDVCIRQLSYCSVKQLVQAYDLQLGLNK